MGRITRLQNDVGHLQAKLADANRKLAAAARDWGDAKKVEARLRELEPRAEITVTRPAAEGK